MLSSKEFMAFCEEREQAKDVSAKPKLGRWYYCKYCHRNVRPIANSLEGVIVCSHCDYGLAPLDAVIEAGSLKAWDEKITDEFAKEALRQLRERTTHEAPR